MVNMTETLIGTLMKSSIDALRIPLGISFVMGILFTGITLISPRMIMKIFTEEVLIPYLTLRDGDLGILRCALFHNLLKTHKCRKHDNQHYNQ